MILFLAAFFWVCCSKKNVHVEEDLSPRFDKAMEYFDRGKYPRAKDEFDYIIMTDPGSTCISSPGDFPFANKEIAGPFVIKERPDFSESIQD